MENRSAEVKEAPPLKLPAPAGGRVETGVVQFGEDWPGVFIRGDNAAAYSAALKALIANRVVQFGEDWPGVFIRGDNMNVFDLGTAQDLANLLDSSRVTVKKV
jgi:hypothetical protein